MIGRGTDTMQTENRNTVSKKMLWAGRIISALPIVFLLLDSVGKLVKPAPVVEATVKLGYPEGTIVPLGIVLLICTVLYAIPQTSVLGAMLLTGYLGGAVATHVALVIHYLLMFCFRFTWASWFGWESICATFVCGGWLQFERKVDPGLAETNRQRRKHRERKKYVDGKRCREVSGCSAKGIPPGAGETSPNDQVSSAGRD